MSRHNISRAQDLFTGISNLPGYQANINGVEITPLYFWRPTGNRAGTFTGALTAGVTSATLSANWAGASGLYQMTLSTAVVLSALLTNGATTCLFYPSFLLTPVTGGSYGSPYAIPLAATSAFTVSGQPPVVSVANGYSVSASIGAAGSAVLGGANTGSVTINGVLYAAAGLPDVPRNVIGAWTTSSTVTVTGFDQYRQVQTETQTGTAFTGKKAFATITSITSTAAITAATFGFGNVLGLPFRVSSGDITGIMFNDAPEASVAGTSFVPPDLTLPATAATGDVRGTYTPVGTLNGAKFLTAVIKVTSRQTTVGAFGVTPV